MHKRVEITKQSLGDYPERVEREYNEALAAVEAEPLPFCPMIKATCRQECLCFVPAKASVTLEKAKASTSSTVTVYMNSSSCDNASMVYQGPE